MKKIDSVLEENHQKSPKPSPLWWSKAASKKYPFLSIPRDKYARIRSLDVDAVVEGEDIDGRDFTGDVGVVYLSSSGFFEDQEQAAKRHGI